MAIRNSLSPGQNGMSSFDMEIFAKYLPLTLAGWLGCCVATILIRMPFQRGLQENIMFHTLYLWHLQEPKAYLVVYYRKFGHANCKITRLIDVFGLSRYWLVTLYSKEQFLIWAN